jgi:hypothetical protein
MYREWGTLTTIELEAKGRILWQQKTKVPSGDVLAT